MKLQMTTSVAASSCHAHRKIVFTLLLALLCSTAQAQGSESLVMIYESPRGVSLDYAKLPYMYGTTALSFDADGTLDLILTSEDDNGNLQGIRIINTLVDSTDVLWEVQDITLELGLDGQQVWRQLGFADPHADGFKDAIFVSEKDVALIDRSDNSLSFYQIRGQLLGVMDMTNDGFLELIIGLTETQQVLVWSRAQ